MNLHHFMQASLLYKWQWSCPFPEGCRWHQGLLCNGDGGRFGLGENSPRCHYSGV